MKKIFAFGIVIFLVLMSVSFVLADGGYMPSPGYWVRPGAQNAIIFYENSTETLIVTSGFFGNAKDLVWLIPTPSIHKVEKANEKVFENIDALTRPEYETSVNLGFQSALMSAGSSADNVIVIENKNVDYYNVSVVFATSSADLIEWFVKNGYEYPKEYSYVLDYYINKQWAFTAMKINTESISGEVAQDIKEGHPTPVKLTFKSDKIVFPLKISSIDFKPKENSTKYGPAANEPIGATRVDNNGNIWTKIGIASWSTSAPGYEGTGWGDILIDEQKGGIDYIDPNSYNYWYDDPIVPIQIYIIADGKYLADNFHFHIRYGNWFDKKTIEDLGVDSNGEPMIKGESERYYITSLSDVTQKSAMSDDLFFKKASDNNKVNAGLEPMQIFLSGLFVSLIALLVWIFFPLFGIIFIVGIIMLFVSARKGVRIAGWILCWTSFGLTLIFGFLVLVISLRYGEPGYFVGGILADLIILIVVILSLMNTARHRPKK